MRIAQGDVVPAEHIGVAQYRRLEITDPTKLAHILTSSFYKDPLEAVIREVLSNAVDSHADRLSLRAPPDHLGTGQKLREGWSKPPKPISISWDPVAKELVIADYGIGIDPAEVPHLLLGLGSSSKDEDNARIGGWGLGAKSPFSLSEQWHFESRWKGRTYTFLCARKDNELTHSDPMPGPTTGVPTGVTVRIPVPPDSQDRIREIARFYAIFMSSPKIPINVMGTLYTGPEDLGLLDENAETRRYTADNVGPFTIRSLTTSKIDDILGPLLADDRTYSYRYRLSSKAKGVITIGGVPYLAERDSDLLSSPIFQPAYWVDLPVGAVDLHPSRDSLRDTQHTRATLDSITQSVSASVGADFRAAWEDPQVSPFEILEAFQEIPKELAPVVLESIGDFKNGPVERVWLPPSYRLSAVSDGDPKTQLEAPPTPPTFSFYARDLEIDRIVRYGRTPYMYYNVRTLSPRSLEKGRIRQWSNRGRSWDLTEDSDATDQFLSSMAGNYLFLTNDMGTGGITAMGKLDRELNDPRALLVVNPESTREPTSQEALEETAERMGVPLDRFRALSAVTKYVPGQRKAPTTSATTSSSSSSDDLPETRLISLACTQSSYDRGNRHGPDGRLRWRDRQFGKELPETPQYYIWCSRGSTGLAGLDRDWVGDLIQHLEKDPRTNWPLGVPTVFDLWGSRYDLARKVEQHLDDHRNAPTIWLIQKSFDAEQIPDSWCDLEKDVIRPYLRKIWSARPSRRRAAISRALTISPPDPAIRLMGDADPKDFPWAHAARKYLRLLDMTKSLQQPPNSKLWAMAIDPENGIVPEGTKPFPYAELWQWSSSLYDEPYPEMRENLRAIQQEIPAQFRTYQSFKAWLDERLLRLLAKVPTKEVLSLKRDDEEETPDSSDSPDKE